MEQLCESLRGTPEQQAEPGAAAVELGIPALDAVQKALEESLAAGKAAQKMAFMEFIQLTTGAANIATWRRALKRK